ncbi:MAG: 3-phosphoshikimate 1-carboxyvinyltransferase, partial [Bacillota bacterium]
MKYKTYPASRVNGTIQIPGDKSISHRSLIFTSLAEGTSYINGLLESEDCLNTLKCFQSMGVNIYRNKNGQYRVEGLGLHGLKEPTDVLYCGNSGTTMRLLTGLLSGQDFYSVLTGDHSLSTRPMDRVIIPLSLMNAQIWARKQKYAPLSINGGKINGICYELPIASAQVKSSIILAGLYTDDDLKIVEPGLSRDHTERMLASFGIDLEINENIIEFKKKKNLKLTAQEITIPGDISSAAFFITAALILPDSELVLENIGINPTRSGFLDIVKKMGANIELYNKKETGGEPVADIRVFSSNLKAVTIDGDVIPTLIDELPLLAVLSTRAEGQTIIKDAEELRVKESDRISTTVQGLRKLGVDVEELEDGMIIDGICELEGGTSIDCHYDHRIAMSFAIAGLLTKKSIIIKNSEAINTSFP